MNKKEEDQAQPPAEHPGHEGSHVRHAAPQARPAKATVPKPDSGRRIAGFLALLMSGAWIDKVLVITSLILVILMFGALVWICWFWAILKLWDWGFRALGWQSFFAPFLIFFISTFPFIAIPLFPVIVDFWRDYLKERGAVSRQVTSARDAQREIEIELSEKDPQQMVKILHYSREMLNEYYAVGMSQAQRSFRYCLIAMWLSFIVLIAGVVDRIFPFTQIFIAIMTQQPLAEIVKEPDVFVSADNLVLLTGAVIEFIAVAFLWVYRYSIQQLTYYYGRQLKLHNTLLAHRLASDADKIKDETVKFIVERLLAETEGPSVSLPGSGGVRKLLGRG